MQFVIGQREGAESLCDLDALVDTRLLVQANSGGGKSWCIRRILEQTFGHAQHLVIDPEGEFSSLRERFDYVLAAKQGGDTIADPRFAQKLAHRLLELNASAILDIYELKAHERIRFVRLFLEALVDAPKTLWHPALVIVDEAHVYCPQRGEAESAGAVIDLMTRGRKRGFCGILATQRLSKLHKDAAAEANNVLIGRSSLDVDMKRAADILGFSGREEQHELRRLAPGEFFAFGPALSDVVARVTVGEVATTHPKAGARIAFTAPPPTEKVRSLLPQLADLPAEAEAERNTVQALITENAQLKREATIAKRQRPEPDEAQIERQVKSALVLSEKSHAAALKAEQRGRERLERAVRDAAAKLTAALNGAAATPIPAPVAREVTAATRPVQISQTVEPRPVAVPSATSGDTTGPETRILNAIAWMEALGIETPEQPAVAFLAGYKYGAGGYNNPRSHLRVKGLVEYVGSRIRLTDAGRSLAEPPDIPLTNAALQEAVLARLPGPEQRVLRPLLDCWPEAMDSEELAVAANYAPNTGGYNNPRGRLRSLGLIAYPTAGYVRAEGLLWPEDAERP